MKGHALLARIANTPWALLPSVCDSLQLVVMYHSEGRRLDQDDIDAIVAGRGDVVARGPGAGAGDAGYTVRSGIAVIPIGGVIAKHAGDVNGSSQPRGTSTETVRQALAAANADTMVNAIMLHIESPGGTVDGVDALAGDIAASGKPVWSVISDLGASAAYWIASQASRVIAGTKTTEVGSIGVYTVLADMAQYYKQRGIDLTTISSGPNKGLGADGRVTDQLKADMQARVNELNAQFVSTVAAGRKRTTDQVRGWASGKVFGAPEALSMGLIDAIQSPEAVLAEMARTFDPRNVSRAPAASAGASPVLITDPIAGANSPTAESAAAVVTAATAAQKESPVKIIAALSALAVPLLLSPDNPNAPGGGGVDTEPTAKDVIAKITPEQAAEVRRQVALESQKIAALERLPGHNAASRKLIQDARKAQETGKPVDLAALQSAVVEAIAQTDTSASDIDQPVRVDETRRMEGIEAAAITLVANRNASVRQTLAAGGEQADSLATSLGFHGQSGLRPAAHALRVLHDAQGQGLRGATLAKLARNHARLAGYSGMDDREVFRAAVGHSTSDFPLLLANVGRKALLAKFAEVRTTWQKWVRRGVHNDYKARNVVRVSEMANFQKLLEGSLTQFTSVNERGTSISIDPYSLGFGYTYQMFRNDDLGEFTRLPENIGLAAARTPENLCWDLLQSNSGVGPTMPDGNAFFSSAHNNLAGSPAAMAQSTLQAMWVAMAKQKSFGNDQAPLDIQPRYVLCGVALQFTAQRFFKDITDNTSNNSAVSNPLQGKFEPIVSPRVTSDTAYWGACDPAVAAGIEISFLDGQETPTIEQLPMQTQMEMRFEAVIPGVGVAAIDWEAMYRNAGA